MKYLKSENFIVIQGWMVKDLRLSGNNLIVYAIIFGFSHIEHQKFTGSRQYLAEFTNSTPRGIQKNLDALTESGLILKEDIFINNVKFCSYECASKFIGGEQSSLVVNNVHTPSEQSSHNTIDIINTKEKNNKKETLALRTIDEDFDISDSMMKWATDKFPKIDVEWVKEETENFKDYYIAKGSKWKDWVRVWQKWIRTSDKKKFIAEGRTPQLPGTPPNPDYVKGTDIEKFERNPDGSFNKNKYSKECANWLRIHMPDFVEKLKRQKLLAKIKLTELECSAIGVDYEKACSDFDEIQIVKSRLKSNKKEESEDVF